MPIFIRNALALTALTLAAVSLSGDGDAPKPKSTEPAMVTLAALQWEYKVEIDINERRMNQLGQQGWELVGFQQLNSRSSGQSTTYIFKRSKPVAVFSPR